MPRARTKAKTSDTVETTTETKRRRRKAAAAAAPETEAEQEEPEAETKPRRRGRPAKRAAAAEPESKPKRGRRKSAEPEPEPPARTREPIETLFVEPNDITNLWDELEDDVDTRVTVNGESVAPRGKRQVEVVEFVKSQGRKKVTAADVIENLEYAGVSAAYSRWVVATCINHGVLEVA